MYKLVYFQALLMALYAKLTSAQCSGAEQRALLRARSARAYYCGCAGALANSHTRPNCLLKMLYSTPEAFPHCLACDGPWLRFLLHACQVLDAAHLDYTVEWYTEASATPDQHEDVATVRKTIPNLTMIFDSDIIWTWENMASADVLVMSLSAFSIVPAIVNSKGLIIRAPPSPIPCAANTASSQWLEPQHDGSLTPDIIAQLSSRLPRATTTGELAAAAVPAPAGLGDLPWRHELITLATGSEQLSGQIALYSSQSRRHLRVQGTH